MIDTPLMRRLLQRLAFTLSFLVVSASAATAQEPFVTADTDTTPRYHYHFQFRKNACLTSGWSPGSLFQPSFGGEAGHLNRLVGQKAVRSTLVALETNDDFE